MDQDASAKNPGPEPASSEINPPAGESQPHPAIPDHQLLREIGQGSYGVVWLARSSMGMYRAIKIVYRKKFDHQKPFDRELSGIRKFEPISRLHEGFMDVLHIGINEAAGYFYYVMELGDDETSGQNINPEEYSPKTLAGEIKQRGKLPVSDCLRLGLALSQALAELHKRGLVHRDIKPSNIIFVNDAPKLADIGLVADVEEARSYVGTEGFIPPEGPGAPQADVYSLGKVLYETSTGKDRQEFPDLPTQWDKAPDHKLSTELNEVILRACKPDPAMRYQSAGDLHAELLLLANGKSVRRLHDLERRVAAIKKGALIACAVLFVVGIIAFQIFREWRVAVGVHQRQVGANVANGTHAMESGDLTAALPFFAEALRLDQGDPSREIPHRLRLGSVLAQCPKLTQMWFTGPDINTGEFSPDGQKILVVHHHGAAGIYDVQSGEMYLHPFGREHSLMRGSFSPDGRTIATAGRDGIASIWDASTLKEIATFKHSDEVLHVRLNHDGSRLITSCWDGKAHVWDTKTGEALLALKHKGAVRCAAFSADERLIATASYDGTAAIWNATNGACIISGLAHPNWVTYVAFSPDGAKLLTTCDDHSVRVWDVETGRRIFPDLKHEDYAWSAEFSPDGRWILTASLDRSVRLWSADTLEPLRSNPILHHNDRVTHAAFSPDGSRILATCTDGTVRVWDLAGCATEPPVLHYWFSSDRNRFLVFTNNTLTVCDTLSAQPISPEMDVSPDFREAKLTADGNLELIATTSTNASGTVEIRAALSGKRLGVPLPLTNHLAQVALSKDGSHLVAFNHQTAQIWDLITGTPGTTVSHSETVKGAAFSAQGNAVATWGGTTVKVWDPATGREFFPPLKNPVPLTHIEFSPDGSRFVTCGADPGFTKCSAQIRFTATGQPVGPPLNHADGVLWASFSHDGKRIATSGEDNMAILWDAATSRQLQVFKHGGQVRTIMFSPDDRWIVTACTDGAARVWNAETGDPLTPPLWQLRTPETAAFASNNFTIVTANSRTNATWIWHLSEDQRPVSDLVSLARLLSGGMTAGSSETPPESLDAIWKNLRIKYPLSFATTTNDLVAWHERQVQESEIATNWTAANFHLNWLRVLGAEDQFPTQEVARVQAHLKP